MLTRFMVLSFLLLLSPLTHGKCELKGHPELAQEVLAEIKKTFNSCSTNIHLTFDDGPSAQHTSVLLKELKARKVRASFFITTTNLDPKHSHYSENKKIAEAILSEGHLMANHGHDHAAYDLRMNAEGKVLEAGFSQNQREAQLKKSIDLLDSATKGKFSKQSLKLFRFPYGRGAMPSQRELQEMARSGQIKLSSSDYASQLKEYRGQSASLQTLAGQGFSHLGWNHDSQDSSHGANMPGKDVLKKYILNNLKSFCASKAPMQVALFHDIKAMNTVAIPVLVDVGQCLGMNFVSAQEMEKQKASLVDRGVYIPKKATEEAPFRNMEDLLSSIMQDGVKVGCEEEERDKSCYSAQYQRSYAHCSGGESICFEGKWYSKTDPLVESCRLP